MTKTLIVHLRSGRDIAIKGESASVDEMFGFIMEGMREKADMWQGYGKDFVLTLRVADISAIEVREEP